MGLLKAYFQLGRDGWIIMKLFANNIRWSWIAFCVCGSAFLNASSVLSETVSTTDAEHAVAGWLSTGQSPLGAQMGTHVLRSESYQDDGGQVLFHVIYLEPSGFVLVSPDTRLEPILAFSEGDVFEMTDNNPLFSLVGKDLRARLSATTSSKTAAASTSLQPASVNKWERLLAQASPRAPKGIASVDDLRVASFVGSRWNQKTAWNGSANVACYNYYTPPYAEGTASNYYSGCVATAYAQVMRYFQYPTVGVGVGSYQIYIDGTPTTRTLRGGNGSGGPYNWTNMPLMPWTGLTAAERQDIGAVCYDAGLAAHMSYTAGSSSGYMPPSSLTNIFRFGNVVEGDGDNWGLMNMINANMDARLPTPLSVQRPGGGHLVLCDGYGYNLSTLYHHINMGWGGSYDAWYALPDIDAGPYHYVVLSTVTYNIYTNGRGEIVSGRVLSSNGLPLTNSLVRLTGAGTTNEMLSGANGIYAFTRLTPNADYTITVTNGALRFPQRLVHAGASVAYGNCGNRWGVDLPAVGSTGFVVAGQIERAGQIGVPGVAVCPDGLNCVTTDASGYYVFTVPESWSGTVMYARERYSLASGSRVYAGVSSNLFAENIAARFMIYVDTDAAGANDGSSWANAFTNLQEALTGVGPGTAILAAEGVYTPGSNRWTYFTLPSGVEVYGGFSGIETDLEQRNPALYKTILSGDIGVAGNPADNCYHVVQGADNALLDSLTVCGGYANGASSGQYGGGIYNAGSPNMLVSQCIVTGNYALMYGGGVYYGKVVNSLLAQNRADQYGGGAYRTFMENCLIYSNSALYGGGMFRSTNVNCTLVENSATFGGGAYEGRLINSIAVSNRAATSGPNYYSSDVSYSCAAPLAAGLGNLNADPRFIDSVHANYRLQISSPCIDTGQNAWVQSAQDLDGQPRIWTNRVDLGAYETIVYTLTATAGSHGALNPTGAVRVLAHSDQTFALTPAPYYHAADVVQAGISQGPFDVFVWTNVTADGTLSAVFAANLTTNTGAPQWWLAEYGLTNFEADAGADIDGDGILSGQEYAADTSPTSSDSCLRMEQIWLDGDSWLRWTGGLSVTQYLEWCDGLLDAWLVIATNTPPTAATNALNVPSAPSQGFYRIRTVR
ncbi:MAG: hypothetical protein A2X46_02515 [Lentisphaerae bacterium GWF2_57_35]|nr:MAG: hypothetical protein A2X46_02515 [Lentisphaerae bacterium GWF2_57_35]